MSPPMRLGLPLSRSAGVRMLRARMREILADEPGASIDYVSVADPAALDELDDVAESAIASSWSVRDPLGTWQ